MNAGEDKTSRLEEGTMIATIIRLKNDAVMVFGAAGEQLTRYQGWYGEVKEAILRDAPREAVFTNWLDSDAESLPVPRKGW